MSAHGQNISGMQFALLMFQVGISTAYHRRMDLTPYSLDNPLPSSKMPQLQAMLKRTYSLEDILEAKKIGEGVEKAAYLIAGWVVKTNAFGGWSSAAEKPYPKGLEMQGLRKPKSYKAGQWIIQEYSTPLKDRKYDTPNELAVIYDCHQQTELGGRLDTHRANVGISQDGRSLVCFDW